MKVLVLTALLVLPACTIRVHGCHNHADDYSGCAMWSPETGACVPRTTTRRLANAR